MTSKTQYLLGAAALLSCTATSCRDDYDWEAARRQSVAYAYAQDFSARFGEPDPQQDYNMATRVTANLSGIESGVLEIFTTHPLDTDCAFLARTELHSGQTSITFDAEKGISRVYVRVRQGDAYYPVSDFYNVVDGVVNVRTTVSRAGTPATGASPVRISPNLIQKTFTTLDWRNLDTNFDLTYTGNFGGTDNYIDGFWLKKDNPYNYAQPDKAESMNFYALENVDFSQHTLYESRSIRHFFYKVGEEEAVFAETVNHLPLMKEESNPHLDKDIIYTMSEDGPVTLDFFAKGTNKQNAFGYFYYFGDKPDVQAFIDLKKYILVDELTNTNDLLKSNLYSYDNSQFYGWTGVQWDHYTEQEGKQIEGTTLQLTYFDADGNASYNFPKGCKIGLFTITQNQSSQDVVYTSISTLNRDLFNEVPRAASFKYKRQIVYGMEDNNDYDINDFMFFVNGNFEETIPDIEDDPDPEPASWIIACEDLGATDDFDFNDVVFRVSHIAGDRTITFTPLAAGGTLGSVVYWKEQRLDEIHRLLNPYTDVTLSGNFPILRTQRGSSIQGANPRTLTLADSELDSFSMAAVGGSNSAGGFQIKVVIRGNDVNDDQQEGKYAAIVTAKEGGAAPQMLVLPSNWIWPIERRQIEAAYPDFASWVQNASLTDWSSKYNDASLVHGY